MGANPQPSRALVRLSREQNGAVHGSQLRALGMTREAIRARVRRGRLVWLFQDVYAVADPELLPLARSSAALLSLGATAVLSHRCAAAAWGLAQAHPENIEVTVVGSNPRPRPGIRVHRVKHLHPVDITTHRNLRLTSPARTMIDFAAEASSGELTDAFGDARARGLLNDPALNAALARAPANHSGGAIVRRMLREGGTYDRSRAERLMRSHVRAAGLPEPVTNVMLHGHLADFVWPDAKLIVEVDGYRTHGNRDAFESDRRRDQVHIAAGYVVIRITWRQLQFEPLAVIARLAQAMVHRAA